VVIKAKSDKDTDRDTSYIPISLRLYEVYFLLIKKYFCQTQAAEELKLTRQTVNHHVNSLEILGLIEPPEENDNPKFYKPTTLIPVVSDNSFIKISKGARKSERTVGKNPLLDKNNNRRKSERILVRDRETGKIKGWKSQKNVGHKRSYDTVISCNGRRIPIFRVHSIASTCTILYGPSEEVPWKHIRGMNEMEQFILKHKFINQKSKLFCMKELMVTFVRQITTGGYDELIIYMPEKYLFEFELDAGERILDDYVNRARKWFQNEFKAYLSIPVKYREKEIAHEIFDAKLKRHVKQSKKHIRIQNKMGVISADTSKKNYPEVERSTVEQIKAELEMPDRILCLEAEVDEIKFEINKMVEMQESICRNQKELMSVIKNIDESFHSLNFKNREDNFYDVV